MIKINIQATLFYPLYRVSFCGIPRRIFSKSFEFELGVENLGSLLSNKTLTILNTCFEFIYFDKNSNTMIIRGYLNSVDLEYLRSFLENGWNLDKRNAKIHNLQNLVIE